MPSRRHGTLRRGGRFGWAAAAIFLVAFAVRLLNLWQIRHSPYFTVLMGDARGYDEWAQQIANGDWLGHDVFYQAPLYPYFLGFLYRVAGRNLLIVRVCQAAIGSLACVLLGLAGRRLFSKRTGLIAGLILALYAPAIFFDGLIQKSVLDVFFVCLMLWLVASLAAENADPANRRPGSFRNTPWFWLGVTVGGLSLTRENALLLAVVLLAWAAFQVRKTPAIIAFLLRRDHRPAARRGAKSCRRRAVLSHDFPIRSQLLHRQQPAFRRHVHVAAFRPGCARVRAPGRHRACGTGARPTPGCGRSFSLLDRSGLEFHSFPTVFLAEADRSQSRAPGECHRGARYRESVQLRRVVGTNSIRRKSRPLWVPCAHGLVRCLGDAPERNSTSRLLRARADLRCQRSHVLRVRAVSVSDGPVSGASRCRGSRERRLLLSWDLTGAERPSLSRVSQVRPC